MFTRISATALSLAMALGAGTALAQAPQGGQGGSQPAAEPTETEKVIEKQSSDQLLSDDLVGMEVRDQANEEIGSVYGLLFNDDDEIVGAVVAMGGILGIGAKHVALSWEEFDVDKEEQVARLGLSLSELEAAPSFRDRATLEAEEEAEQAREQQRQGGTGGGGAPQPGGGGR